MKHVWIYVRVSTREQVQGYSLEEQVATCRRYFDYKYKPEGYILGEPFVDAAVSTKRYDFRQRPQGSKLFLGANPGDVVVFAKLDRAFRNTVDCLSTVQELRDRGVSVVFLDVNADLSTPQGEFFLTCLAAFARMERLKISERTKEGVQAAIAAGKLFGPNVWGTYPAGPPRHKYLVLHGAMFREAVKIYRLLQENWTIDDLYWWLKAEGIERPRTSKQIRSGRGAASWTRSVIAEIPSRLARLIELVNSGKVRVLDGTKVPKSMQELMEGRDDERDESDGTGSDGGGPDALVGGSEACRSGDRAERDHERHGEEAAADHAPRADANGANGDLLKFGQGQRPSPVRGPSSGGSFTRPDNGPPVWQASAQTDASPPLAGP